MENSELDPDLQALINEERSVASTRQSSFNTLKLEKGCSAYVRFLPVELGPRKSWFARIARHWVGGRPVFCVKHSAPDFNGNPKAHCPLCDLEARYGQDRDKTVATNARRIGAFPKWVVYLYVWETIDDRNRKNKTAEQDMYVPTEFWFTRDTYLELTNLWERSARLLGTKMGFLDPLLGYDFSLVRDNRNGLKIHEDMKGAIIKGKTEQELYAMIDEAMLRVKLPDYTPATTEEMEEAVEKAEDLIMGRRARSGDDRGGSTRSRVDSNDEDERGGDRGGGRGGRGGDEGGGRGGRSESAPASSGRGGRGDPEPTGRGRGEPEPQTGRGGRESAPAESRGRTEPAQRESRREEAPATGRGGRESAPPPSREEAPAGRTGSDPNDFEEQAPPPPVSSRTRGTTASDILPPRTRSAPPPPPERGGRTDDEKAAEEPPRERRDAAPPADTDPATLPATESTGGRGAPAAQSRLSETSAAAWSPDGEGRHLSDETTTLPPPADLAEVVTPCLRPKKASTKPKLGKKVSIKSNKPDITSRVLTKLNSVRPKGSGGKEPTVNMEFSRSSVKIMSAVTHVLSTGIESYDMATGIGGLPFGRVVELYGLDGSLKSAMALRSAVRLQGKHIYKRIRHKDGHGWDLEPISKDTCVFTIYIDNEQSIDEDDKLIIDGTELDCAVARCDTVDQLFKIVDTAITEAVKVAKESGLEVFIAVVADTIAGTSSREEMTDAWDKENYQRQAKALRQGFRIMIRELARHNVLVIATNQVGDSFAKKMKGGGNTMIPQDADFSTFGGRALKFYASMRIFMYKLNVNWKLSKKRKFPSGMVVGFTVTKNRLGKPWRSGRIVCLYEGGMSNAFSRLETMSFLKLCERNEDGSGQIAFKCAGANIPLTTFPELANSRTQNPTMDSLEEWPAFLEKHRPEMDALWQRARDIMFKEEAPAGSELEEADDESVESDVDVVEE